MVVCFVKLTRFQSIKNTRSIILPQDILELGCRRLPLRWSAPPAGRGLAPKSTGRTRWLEAPAPPIDEGGSTPCNPLRRSSPFPTLSSPKSRDRVGPLVRTSLRSTHRTARDATPVAWGLPDQPGSKRASRRAPMALRSARLAAADYGNGRRRCPKHLQFVKLIG